MCFNKEFQSQFGKGRFMHAGPGRFGGYMAKHPAARGFFPPVNVLETDEQYELLVYAPALTKSDFNIQLKDDLLTVSARAKQPGDLAEATNWRRQEYRPDEGFERSFVVNEKVDTAQISATYAEGVLVVTLPKLPGAATKRQDVAVA